MGYFIVCPGRCGSTHLGTFLGNLPEFQMISETWSYRTNRQALLSADLLTPTDFVRQLTVPPPRDALRVLKTQQQARDKLDTTLNIAHQRMAPLKSRDFHQLYSRLLGQQHMNLQVNARQVFSALCTTSHKPAWIEKTGGSLRYAQTLFERFPGTGFVILERDLHAVARSKSLHPGFVAGLLFRHQAELEPHFVQHLQQGKIRAADRAKLMELFLEEDQRPAEALECLLQHTPPGHFYRCSYETMVQHPGDFIRATLEFLANRRPTDAEVGRFVSQTRPASSIAAKQRMCHR